MFALKARGAAVDDEGRRAAETADGVARASDLLLAREAEVSAFAAEAAAGVARAGDAEAAFRFLDALPRPGSVAGVTLRDRLGTPVAWTGRVFDFAADRGRASSGVFGRGIYRVLWAEAPVADTGAAVQVFSLLDVRWPLQNRYLRGVDFGKEAARELSLREVRLGLPGPECPEVRTARGDLLTGVSVTPRSAGERVARLSHLRRQVRGAVLAAAVLGLLVLLGWRALRPGARPAAVLAFVAAAAAGRAALPLFAFPALLLPGPAFEGESFSVPTTLFGLDLGLLRSPGDAFITAAFLHAVVAVVLLALWRRFAPRLPAAPRPIPAALAAVAAVVLFVPAVLAWERYLNLLNFQSTVNFFPEDSVLPALPAALLLLSVFLTTLSLLLVIGGATFLACRLGAAGSPRRFAVGAALAALVLFVLLRHLLGASLLPALVAAAAVPLTAAVIAGWAALGSGLRTAALTGLSATFSFLPFVQESWREGREAVEEEVEEALLGAEAAHLAPFLEADLARVAADPLALAFLRLPASPPGDLAFRLWANSRLPERTGAIDLSIRDRTGQGELSRFELRMPPRAWLPDPMPGTTPQRASVAELFGRAGGRNLRFLVGTAPVLAPESGEFLGEIVARVPAGAGDAGGPPLPPVLGPRDEPAGSRPLPPLFTAEFDRQGLVRTSNPEYPQRLPLPAAVAAALFTRGADSLWQRERIGDVWYMNYYRPRRAEGEVTGVICVGFPSRERFDILLTFFRYALLFAVLAAAGFALHGLAALRRLRLRFHHKLLISYIVVSGVPVLLLARVNSDLADSTVRAQRTEELRRAATLVREEFRERDTIARLSDALRKGAPIEELRDAITDEDLKEVSRRVNQTVNLFLAEGYHGRLAASSEPGLRLAGTFPDPLPGRAWLETVTLGRAFHETREALGDYEFPVAYTPLTDGEGRTVAVVSLPAFYGQEAVERELARRITFILAVYLAILVLVVCLGMVLARRISSPIERLVKATERLSAGDLEYRIPGGSRDEFGYLVESFNRMTGDLRESRDRLVKAERDAAWREMAKQIAHEIKNPLTPLRLSAQHIERAYKDRHPEFADILERGVETIIRQVDALKRIAGDFSAFARLQTRPLAPVDPAAVAREAAGLFRGTEGIAVVERIEAVPPVLADADDLRRVLVNLATNGLQAMEGRGGTLTLHVRPGAGAGPGRVVLAVSDTGAGISEADQARLFEPAFSTKKGGTGLGLAISRAIVVSFGGTIAIASKPGEGTTVTVTLPAATPQ